MRQPPKIQWINAKSSTFKEHVVFSFDAIFVESQDTKQLNPLYRIWSNFSASIFFHMTRVAGWLPCESPVRPQEIFWEYMATWNTNLFSVCSLHNRGVVINRFFWNSSPQLTGLVRKCQSWNGFQAFGGHNMATVGPELLSHLRFPRGFHVS